VKGKARASVQKRRLFQRVNLFTSILLVFPLFLIYQVGVLALPNVRNGADLITSELLDLLHGQIGAYVLVNLGLGLLFVVLVLWFRRKNTFDPKLFWPVFFESGIYALTMGSLIVFVMQDVLHVDPSLRITATSPFGQRSPGPLSTIVLSIGAGVHEEFVFRLLLTGGLLLFFGRVVAMRRIFSIALSLFVSSLLFSAAHHVIGGEPFRLGAFVYRFLCGIFFAILYLIRGFGVAVYTHALYDMYVLFLRS
jgi:membrane protease YdiL (CAAX protease family)